MRFLKSIDGGKTFGTVRTLHGDNHDLWINPDSPDIMVQANDGGAHVSLDGARTWSTIHNQPTAEFYRVTVDDQFPYRLYGAQQDNSTISISSRAPATLAPGGDWHEVGGGESGHIAVDPRNPELAYSGNYIGQIDRYDRGDGTSRNVILYPQMADGMAPKDLKYRFQWNAPILISPHDPDVVYHASQHVHRTRDGGATWETISPDLTRDDPDKQPLPGGPIQHDHTGVEIYSTVFALVESTLAQGRAVGRHRRRTHPPQSGRRRRPGQRSPRRACPTEVPSTSSTSRGARPGGPTWRSTSIAKTTSGPTSSRPRTTGRPGRC